MKVSLLGVLLYFLSVNSAESTLDKHITSVDIVLNGLKDQSWSEDEGQCLDQTLFILNNVKNYTVWAMWIWNSMHHPVGTLYGSQYSLGNYDQCMTAPSISADPAIIPQYCLADVALTDKKFEGDERNVLGPMEPYVAKKTKIGRNLNKITWGACLPAVCKAHSMSKILKTMYLSNPLSGAQPEITVVSCQVAGVNTEYSFGYYAFIMLVTTLVATSILSTYFLQNSTTKCIVLQSIADSYCLKRNWASFTKKSDEAISSLNVLKIFLATLAVWTHTSFFEIMGPISNGVKFDESMLELNSPLKNIVKNINFSVDIFLMVSGLLLVKGLMEKKKNPLISLINRYFRFISSFAVIIFYVAAVSIYTGDGPTWQRFAGREQKACSDNWWLNLLMLNNYVNSEDICLIVSWYIPCEYQLAIMGTILFLLWQKNKKLGEYVTSMTVVVAVLMPGIVTYWRKLPGAILYHDLEKILDFRKNDVYLDTYIRSHNRAGPYLLGMGMGYVMAIYKPKDFRNIISKKLSFALFAISVIVFTKISTTTLAWTTLEYDHLSSAFFAVYSKNLWTLAFCVVIVVVEYGDVGIRKFTDWHGFTILSRLAFGVYSTHSVILQNIVYSKRNPQQFDIFSEVVNSLGVLIVSAIVATFLWLFVESPVNNIVNLFTDSRSRDKKKPKD